jgi:hypothetical protein
MRRIILSLGLFSLVAVASHGAGIEKQISGSPGGIGTGGPYLLMGSIQSAAGVAGSGGPYTTLSGYLTFRSTITFVTRTAGGQRRRDGWELGVSTSAPVEFHFSGPVANGTLASAISVRRLTDHLTNPIEQEVPFVVSYDTRQVAAQIVLPQGWAFGNTYRLNISTHVLDADLNPISEGATVRIEAVRDFSARNVITALDDPSARVDLSAGAFSGVGFILFHSDPLDSPDRISRTQIETADRKALSILGPSARSTNLKELNAYDSAGNELEGDFSAPVTLTVPFADADGDGRLDENPNAYIKNLSLWVLDERTNLWVRLPASSVDNESSSVTAPLQHFSVYALLAAPDRNVDLVYPFPVPWRPFADNPQRYGTASGGITFANLPQEGVIQIFTLGGRLVREEHLSGASVWNWDVRNSAGEDVVSGVYLWVIKAGANRKSGKLMVVR